MTKSDQVVISNDPGASGNDRMESVFDHNLIALSHDGFTPTNVSISHD